MLLQLSQFFFSLLSSSALHPTPHSHPHSLPFSSCPKVVHISSLTSPFPILFLTSPCLFCAYLLCFLFPVPFPLILSFPFPTGYPPCDAHFCDSVPVLVVCLVFVFYVQLLTLVSLLSFYCRWFFIFYFLNKSL